MKSKQRWTKPRGWVLPVLVSLMFMCGSLPLAGEESSETHLAFFSVAPNLNYVSALDMTLGYYHLTTPRIFTSASILIAFGRLPDYTVSGNVFAGYSFPLFERYVDGLAFIPGVFIEFHKPDYYYHNAVNAGMGLALTKLFVLSKHWRIDIMLQTTVSFIPENEVIVHVKPSIGVGVSW